MQNVYAFKQCQESDYHIAVELIKETFSPDLNSMEVQNKELLEEKKSKAMALFEKSYQSEMPEVQGEDATEIKKATVEAINFYKKQERKDFEFLRKNMVNEAEKIYDRYLLVLLLLVEFADFVEAEFEKKSKLKSNPLFKNELNLNHNKIIQAVRNNKALRLEAIKRNLDWSESKDDVRQWYKEVIKKDPNYIAYKAIEQPAYEEDKQIVNHLIKNIVFKNEMIQAYFDEKDINWIENKVIVKSMVAKTIKSVNDEGEESDFELVELSSNWEDDSDFFKELFSKTITYDAQYEALISKKTKNWDVERIASIDKIILKMAVNEMINFPSIPVKVTINEYIEISKNYSTPKSRQFINGILDVLAAELTEEGVIKKSGRGLIDNK